MGVVPMKMKKYIFFVLFLCVTDIWAHSWLECADWRPNKDGDWTNGVCKGRPRSWGKNPDDNAKPFDCYREFREDQNQGTVCNPNREGPHPNPVSSAYSTDNPMTVVTTGQKLCWRWPAKNHDDNKGYQTPGNRLKDHPVFVNWAPKPTDPTNGQDPTQADLLQGRVIGIDFEYCNEVGDSDKKPCGGCFTVPNVAVGTYLVQWWWEFNDGEIYISCADIEVNAGGTNALAPTYPTGYLGCYQGVTGDGQTLGSKGYAWPDAQGNQNSPANCVATCKAAGHKYAGLLFSTDCWCGDTEPSISARSTNNLVDCAMQCTADVTKICGGNTAASVYLVEDGAGVSGSVPDPGYNFVKYANPSGASTGSGSVDDESNGSGKSSGSNSGSAAAIAIVLIVLASAIIGGAYWYYKKNNGFPFMKKLTTNSEPSARGGDYVRFNPNA